MSNKKIIIFSTCIIVLGLMLSYQVLAQQDLNSLTSKVAEVSIQGKTPLEVLNTITQEGELDATKPKRTIQTSTGRETIFVFDFGSNHQVAFDDLLNYFQAQENFQVVNEKEGTNIRGVELQKGDTKILLVKKASMVVEDRQENISAMPEPPKTEATSAEGQTEKATSSAKTSVRSLLWLWILIPVVVVILILAIILPRLGKK